MLNYQLLYEIGKHLIAETDMHKLLQLAMDKIIESTQAQRGMITVIDADGALLFETARNLEKRDIEKPEFEVSRTLIDSVLRSGEAVVLANALEDSAYAASKSIVELKILSVACAPLKIAGRPFGVIYIDNREITSLFTEETGAWLQEFADLIAVAVKNVLDRRQLVSRQRRLLDELAERKGYGKIIGNSPRMQEVHRLIDDVAGTDATVLITGETGTGKELIARALHMKSSRRDHEFVALNCAAIPENLIESELFGHEKGAFTGAGQRKQGWIEAAHRGTLFLDEIGEIPPNIQIRLLRFLQSGEYAPLGQTKLKHADVRIIAATHRNLAGLVERNVFRQDLFYRINVLEIHLPALRERGEDILQIAEYFLRRYGDQFRKPGLQLSDEARQFLLACDFPGNVRELENMIQRAVLLTRGPDIGAAALASPAADQRPLPANLADSHFNTAKQRMIDQFEIEFISARLTETGGNISEAARKSGMHKANFIQKMRKHGIRREEFLPRR